MTNLRDTVQTADWKNEKHVPVLEATKNEDGTYLVTAEVGKEIAHPNTFEHYISWIKVYYLAEGAKLPVEIASTQFTAHGEAEAFTHPKVAVNFKAEKGGKLLAQSYCNIHGLWESSLELN